MILLLSDVRQTMTLLACACVMFYLVVGTLATDRPIIGVLSVEVNPQTYPNHSSFIPASYIKAVEQAGARVVPILINQTDKYYKVVLDSVNGVLFPGGGVSFTNKGGFADAGQIIVKYAEQKNKHGDHFPILGVCLGFELFFYLSVESFDVLENCSAVDVSLPLKFSKDFRNSRLYQDIPPDIAKVLRKEPVTFHHHKKCVTKKNLNKYHLQNKWNVLSTSTDVNNLVFISSAESYQYPIAGVQFHPEKVAYEWSLKHNIPHSETAINVNRYFYDWLVKEARKNNHSFNTVEEENAAVIYNYNMTYVNNYYEQVYLFD